MKAIILSILVGNLLLAINLSACSGAGSQQPPKGFAVVELFTSEGCSSCPPADQLLARIQEENKDQPVYILAFHVDYWDKGGWKDTFSDADYTLRQNQYAFWLRLQTIYTPQVIINGSKEFVGSDEPPIRKAISNALQEVSPVQLTLDNIKVNKGKLTWHYQTTNAGNTQLLVAIVQKSATSQVKAGENNGRTLSHVQIVRRLETADVKANGNGAIRLPAGVDTSDEELIAFLQETGNGRIIAATRAALP